MAERYQYTDPVSKLTPAAGRNMLPGEGFPEPDDAKVRSDIFGGEYGKHYEGMSKRYPMLTALLLRGKPQDTANLSTLEDTDKYARLADAYNAQLRYKPMQVTVSGIGNGGVTATGQGQYEQVPQLSTQDQKQAELNRQTQGALRGYRTGEESAYQRDLLKRKMDEMQKVTEKGYEREWWKGDETIRREMALFDMWKGMEEEEFTQFLANIGIKGEQAARMMDLIKNDKFPEAAFYAQTIGISSPTAADMYNMMATSNIFKKMAEGMSYANGARMIGEVGAAQVLETVQGMLSYADASGDPTLQKLAGSVRTAAGQVGDAAEFTSKHLNTMLMTGAGAAALASLTGFVLPLVLGKKGK
jgi:hypothetical protein